METKPNILVILSDQQRYDTLHAAGYDHMITPNLDRLCQEGCMYTHAHTHNPVCMPARHDLLIGMPAGAHGYFANRGNAPIKDYGIPTLPQILSENGYRTAAIGKMHFSPNRAHHGYGEMQLMEEIPKVRENDEYGMYLKSKGLDSVMNLHGIRPLIYHKPQKSQVPMEHYETSWVKDRTIEWLESNGENPFMLCVGYIKPHPPWDIPQEYQGIYSNKDLPKAIERARQFPCDNNENPWYGDNDDDETRRNTREAYYTSVTMVDNSVGEIIEHLRKTGQLDNTLVIYTSDHGEMLQDKGYFSKNVPYEGAVRVPFILRYPKKVKAGSQSSSFVDLMDILPTCLDVAGVEYPIEKNRLWGESLITEQPTKDRSHIIAACGFLGPRRWVSVRNDNYKYIYWHNGGFEEMYDMINDPGEVTNIIESMKGSLVYNKFKQQVFDYELKWGPQGSVNDGQLIDLEPELLPSWISSKFPIWMNSQFQKFYHGRDKKSRFNDEMEWAIGRQPQPGLDTLDDDYWLSEFDKNIEGYNLKS